MWSAMVLLGLCAVSAESFTVTTLDGKSLQGEIQSLDASGLVIKTASGEIKVALANLAEVRGPDIKAASPKVYVTLADGSELKCADFFLDAKGARAFGVDDGELTLPRRSIRWVRWLSNVDRVAWDEALATPAAGDLLVVRKAATAEDGGTKINLDPLEGMVTAVAKTGVAFDFDGDPINVKAEKVEGIVFFKPSEPLSLTPLCKVSSPNWGTIVAAEVKLAGEQLNVKTLGGVTIPVSLGRGTVLDFQAGNLRWLADVEPDSVKSAFSLQPAGMKVKFSDLFAPRSEGPFGGRGLAIGKQTFKSGLTLHSPTTMTWRIPEGFSVFRAAVGLPDDAAAGAKLKVRVSADQQVVFEQQFSAADAREAVELECKVTGAKRLTIVVEAGEGLDFGDTVILGDARFVK